MPNKQYNSVEFWPGTRKNVSFKNTVLDSDNYKILQQTYQEMKHELVMAGTRGITGVRITIFFTDTVNPTPYQGFHGKTIKKLDRKHKVKSTQETDLDSLTSGLKNAKLTNEELNNLPRMIAQQLINSKKDFEQLKADIEKHKPQVQSLIKDIEVKNVESRAASFRLLQLEKDEAELQLRVRALKSVEGINYETYITYRGKKFKAKQLEQELKMVVKEKDKITIKSNFEAKALNIIPVTRLRYTEDETKGLNEAWDVFNRVKKQDPDLIDSSGSEFNEDYSEDDSDD
jgi:hypothetical protein